MKIRNNLFPISFLFCLLFVACTDESPIEATDYFIFGIHDYEQAKSVLGDYAELGKYSDGLSKLITRKQPSINDESVSFGEIVNLYSESPSSELKNVGDFYANNLKSVFKEDFKKYAPSNYSNNSEELGEKIFAFSGSKINLRLLKGTEEFLNEELYYPKSINADLSSFDKQEFTSRYIVDRNRFSFSWDKDLENENGLIVAIQWFGEYANNEHPNGNGGIITGVEDEVTRVMLLKESDEGIIPSDLFSGIPNNAVVTMTLMRGSVSSASTKDNINFQLQAMHEEIYRVALISN